MHPDEYHILDPARLHRVPDLVPLVADNVFSSIDINRIDLALPWASRIAVDRLQMIGPFLVDQRIVIVASVRLIDRVVIHFLPWYLLARASNVLGEIGCYWRGHCSLPRGMILVKIHTIARRVHD